MGSTKGVLLIPEMKKLVIKDMYCPYVDMVIVTLIASEKPLLCVEGVQHLVLFILGITLPKHLDYQEVKHLSV